MAGMSDGPAFIYMPPTLAQFCACRGNVVKALFCKTGHLLECHFPMGCEEAGCAHLANYNYIPEHVELLRKEGHANLLELVDPDCELCSGSGIVQVDTSVFKLMGGTVPSAGDREVTVPTLCSCVMERRVTKDVDLLVVTDPKFDIGPVSATNRVMQKWESLGRDPQKEGVQYIRRHAVGDWGDLDDDDKAINDRAVVDGDRILSRYEIEPDFVIYIITEADRSMTTILLTDEY